MNAEINVKSCHKSAKSFPLSLFQDSNLESGFLGGFCIDNGSFISILNWVLHTLNRPHCLERVAPRYIGKRSYSGKVERMRTLELESRIFESLFQRRPRKAI